MIKNEKTFICYIKILTKCLSLRFENLQIMNNTKLFFLLLIIWVLPVQKSESQQARFGLVAFYNVENLYDTIKCEIANDAEFLPNAPKRWNSQKYFEQIDHLSEVISKLGHHENLQGSAAIIGLCEVENRSVLEDLVQSKHINHLNYRIIHFDSPDLRGMDVALLYQPRYFRVTNARAVPLLIYDQKNNYRIFTRDQLVVSGDFDGEPMHFIVNHWPSRRSDVPNGWLRNEAAKLTRSLVDSIINIDKNAKIIVMGDLNDDPTDESVSIYLNAKSNQKKLKPNQMFNPMGNLFKKGVGSLAYQDRWNLFDQIILTQSFLDKQQYGYRYHSVRVFNDPFLRETDGRFKGYPKRTYVGNEYKGGYSDHFPVYIVLVKKM